MGKLWAKNLFADLSADKKLESKIPVGPFVETAKTDGTRNPKHAVSYASVAAGKRKTNDDEEKSPFTTLLPATPERHEEKGLAKLARNLDSTYRIRQIGQDNTDHISPASDSDDDVETIFIQTVQKQARHVQPRTSHCLLCNKTDHYFNACPTMCWRNT